MPPRTTITRTPGLASLLASIQERTAAAQADEAAVHGDSGGGLLDKATSAASRFGASLINPTLSTVGIGLKVLDLPRQYVSKPLLGGLVATVEGRWGEVGDVNDLRRIWDETDVPGPFRFAAEVAADPTIWLGGFGFWRGSGAKLATTLAREGAVIKNIGGEFQAARYAARWGGLPEFRAFDNALVNLQKTGAPVADDVARGVVGVLERDGVLSIPADDAMRRLTLGGEEGRAALRALTPTFMARKAPTLARMLAPVEATYMALWNIPFAAARPLVMRAGKPVARSLAFGIDTATTVMPARKAVSWLAGRSQYFADFQEFREVTGKGFSEFLTQQSMDSVQRVAATDAAMAFNHVKEVAARDETLGSVENVISLVLKDDERALSVFNAGIPGANHPSLDIIRDAFAHLEPADEAAALRFLTEGGEARFLNEMQNNLAATRAAEFGIVAAPQVKPTILHNFAGAITNVLRPLNLARPDFPLVELPDNILRGGNLFAVRPAAIDFYTKTLGLPNEFQAGKLGVKETLFDFLLPFRTVREKKVAAQAVKGITQEFTDDELRVLQREIDELPDHVVSQIGSFTAAPDADPDAVYKLLGGFPALSNFIKRSQRGMMARDARAAFNLISDATSEAVVRDVLTAAPQSASTSEGLMADFFQKIEDLPLNPNVKRQVHQYGQRIVAGDPTALTEATRRFSRSELELHSLLNDPSFMQFSKTARENILADIHTLSENGLPVNIAAREALRTNSALITQTAGETLGHTFANLKAAEANLDDIYRDLNIDRSVSRQAVEGAHKSSGKVVRSLEKNFDLTVDARVPLTEERRAAITAERRQLQNVIQNDFMNQELEPPAELLARQDELQGILHAKEETVSRTATVSDQMARDSAGFSMANSDIDVTIANQLSQIASGNGDLAAHYLPYTVADAELATRLDNHVKVGHDLVQDYAKAVAKNDPNAGVHLRKLARVFPDFANIAEMEALPAPTLVANQFAAMVPDMWTRYLGAKLMMGDEIAARAASRAGRFDQRSYYRIVDRMYKEIVRTPDLPALRGQNAARLLEQYQLPDEFYGTLEVMESNYEALGVALKDKYQRLNPREAAATAHGAIQRLDQTLASFEQNAGHTDGAIESLSNLWREADGLAQMPDVQGEMVNRLRHHASTTGIEAWRRGMVDYRHHTNLDRLAGFFSMYPIWGMRLPGYLMKQFAARPGFIVAMNHAIQSGPEGGMGGIAFGGGYFFAPHLRMSVLPLMAREGTNFVQPGSHPLQQMSQLIQAFGMYPGPQAQLTMDAMGKFLNETGITTSPEMQVTTASPFGMLPAQVRWVRDFTRLAGINEGRGVSFPFSGGEGDLFARATERELASRVAAKITQAEVDAGRPLYPEEIVDIRNAVYDNEQVSARRTVAGRDLVLATIPGAKYIAPEETHTISAAVAQMKTFGMDVDPNLQDVRAAYFKLSTEQKSAIIDNIPAIRDLISLSPGVQTGDQRAINRAKQNFFRATDSIWAGVSRKQRLLDQQLESGKIDPKTWREARSDMRLGATREVDGVKRDPLVQLWLARGEKGTDQPEELAWRDFNQLEPTDLNGDGLILDDDLQAFFDARDSFLQRQPSWIRNFIVQRRQQNLTPLEVRYEGAREKLSLYFDLPRFSGLSADDGERANAVINQARLVTRMTGGEQSLQEVIMRLPNVPSADKSLALQAMTIGANPGRAQFWAANPILDTFFPDLRPGGVSEVP